MRAAIHASQVPHAFKECTDPPYNALQHQDGLPATEQLVYVLAAGVRVLLFSGQFDVICNHLGTEKLLAKLDWAGAEVRGVVCCVFCSAVGAQLQCSCVCVCVLAGRTGRRRCRPCGWSRARRLACCAVRATCPTCSSGIQVPLLCPRAVLAACEVFC